MLWCIFDTQMPETEDEWRQKIAGEFNEKCNFPHCAGALDGKHITILPPPNSGSQYFNYKHYFSIVLLALVDANYRFLYVDIGCYGRMSDGGVYNNSSLAEALANNTLHIPAPEVLSSSDITAPYVVVADDAFALKPYQLMSFIKPFVCNRQYMYFTYDFLLACLSVFTAQSTDVLKQRSCVQCALYVQWYKAQLCSSQCE